MKYEGKFEGREIARRPTRIDVYYDALVELRGAEIAAQILNLSAHGFRIRTYMALKEGDDIFLTVPKYPPVRGEVRWTDGFESGGILLDAVAL